MEVSSASPTIQDAMTVTEQVTALRHLPPNAALPKPSYDSDRELFEAILALVDGINPLHWLQCHRSGQVSRALIYMAFEELNSYAGAIQKHERAFGQPNDLDASRVLSLVRLMRELHMPDLFSAVRPTDASSQQLESLLRSLQAACRGIEIEHWQTAKADSLLPLLGTLVHLPSDADPVEFVMQHYPSLAAYRTLIYLIRQVLPVPAGSFLSGPQNKPLRPPLLLYSTNELTIVLEDLLVSTDRFAVIIRARIAHQLLQARLPKSAVRVVRWDAVESAVDDEGLRYLLCLRHVEGNSRRHDYEMRIKMIYYPALATSVKSLGIQVRNAVISSISQPPLDLKNTAKSLPIHIDVPLRTFGAWVQVSAQGSA